VALDRFFTEANLTALRELALRFTAGRVDEQLREIMTGQGIDRTWAVTTRLAVVVDHRSNVRAILRRAAEMAATMRGELIALAVETPADAGHGHDRAQDLRENVEYAEELGAEVIRREAPSVIDGVVAIARERRVTHLVLRYEPPGRIAGLLRPALADQIMARLPEVEILLIGRGAAAAG
jgi:two-component system sensor histidine kinase KdpD